MTQQEFDAQHYNAHPKCLMDSTQCFWCKKISESLYLCTTNVIDEIIGIENAARAWYCPEWLDKNNVDEL